MKEDDLPYLLLFLFLGALLPLVGIAASSLYVRLHTPASQEPQEDPVPQSPKKLSPYSIDTLFSLPSVFFLPLCVGVLFLFPCAVIFLELTIETCLALLLFILILLGIYSWAWHKSSRALPSLYKE